VRIEERALLHASPDAIWSVLTEWERQASWMPDVAWIRVVGTRREDGAVLEVKTKVLGVPAVTDRLRVTGWEPPHRLEIVHEGLVRGRGEWRLVPLARGTGFVWLEELEMPFPPLGDVALRVYAPVQRWMLRRSIANLRRIVERPPAPGSG
jgi:Polyketide cyclase / dehydrase and lipid transport